MALTPLQRLSVKLLYFDALLSALAGVFITLYAASALDLLLGDRFVFPLAAKQGELIRFASLPAECLRGFGVALTVHALLQVQLNSARSLRTFTMMSAVGTLLAMFWLGRIVHIFTGWHAAALIVVGFGTALGLARLALWQLVDIAFAPVFARYAAGPYE